MTEHEEVSEKPAAVSTAPIFASQAQPARSRALPWVLGALGVLAVLGILIAISQSPVVRPAETQSVTATIAGVRFEFIPVNPGEFLMGSENGDSDERPVHQVRITRPFELGKYEVTQGQWRAVMGGNPSYFKSCGEDCPVEQVSWDDVENFLDKLNERNDGYQYRLPTEAEWEYACRAKTTDEYAGNLDAMGWYDANSGGTTHSVGKKASNAWGLYDMHGNVGEWCQDGYGHYPSGMVTDPQGPSSGPIRVLRGGSWDDGAGNCRSANRSWNTPFRRNNFLGFRLLRIR
jgi:formylglycine-generating enzyme required for sulfatase activity